MNFRLINFLVDVLNLLTSWPTNRGPQRFHLYPQLLFFFVIFEVTFLTTTEKLFPLLTLLSLAPFYCVVVV